MTIGLIYSVLCRCRAWLLLSALAFFAPELSALDFTVSNLSDSGPGSLRQAIIDANTTVGPDQILFSIPGPGPHLIQPASPLPAINEALVIDGISEPDYLDRPVVILDGSMAGLASDGLRVLAGQVTIQGLSVVSFDGDGILLQGGNGLIRGNYIGLRPDYTCDANRIGVHIDDAAGWRLGDLLLDLPNFISGNDLVGVVIDGPGASDNELVDNYIGVRPDGVSACAGQDYGVRVLGGAIGNFVGLPGHPDKRNLISGNSIHGVNGITFGNHIYNCWIGTDHTGNAPLGNGLDGIEVFGDDWIIEDCVVSGNGEDGLDLDGERALIIGNHLGLGVDGLTLVPNTEEGLDFDEAFDSDIGDGTPDGRNLISGNGRVGIAIGLIAAENVRIRGNYIGTDITGLSARPNAVDGITIFSGLGVVIGGGSSGEGNVISGNGRCGIEIQGSGTSGNVYSGNYLGLGADGMTAIPNGANGIHLKSGAHDNLIGGAGPGEGNVISANSSDGIHIASDTGADNYVLGNTVGRSADGSVARGNGNTGVEIAATENFVGGSGPGMGNTVSNNLRHGVLFSGSSIVRSYVIGNTIEHNGMDGVSVQNSNAVVSIMSNGIHGNLDLGIDLGADGPNPNDNLDVDLGPNSGQNSPVLTTAVKNGGVTIITGTFHGQPLADFNIEFFTSPTSDGASLGQGKVHVGTTIQTSDGAGNFTIATSIPGLNVGDRLTATCTHEILGNTRSTSEFSAEVVIVGEICGSGLDEDGDGLVDCADPDCYLASTTGESDVDTDGVGEYCDIDDDNDGVPDESECSGTWTLDGPVTVDALTSTHFAAHTDDTQLELITSNGILIDLANTGALTHIQTGFTDPLFNGTQTAYIMQIESDDRVGEHGLLSLGFPEGVWDVYVAISDLSAHVISPTWSGSLKVLGSNSHVLLHETDGDFALEYDYVYADPSASTNGQGILFFPGYREEIEFELGHHSPTDTDGPLKFSINLGYTRCQTGDGDGVPSHLDLDSDNDGLYDLTEAGHAGPDADNDGRVDDTSHPFGLNGLSDGLETSAESDAINYGPADTDTDGTSDFLDVDSDDDGCSDVIEAGFPDSDGDGQLGGIVPPTVSIDGKVTSGGI